MTLDRRSSRRRPMRAALKTRKCAIIHDAADVPSQLRRLAPPAPKLISLRVRANPRLVAGLALHCPKRPNRPENGRAREEGGIPETPGIPESPCASARKSLSRRSATSSSSGARYGAALSGRRSATEPSAPPQVCLKPPVSASVIGVWTGCLSKCAIARPKSSMSSAARSRVRPCRTKIRCTATSARLAGRV